MAAMRAVSESTSAPASCVRTLSWRHVHCQAQRAPQGWEKRLRRGWRELFASCSWQRQVPRDARLAGCEGAHIRQATGAAAE